MKIGLDPEGDLFFYSLNAAVNRRSEVEVLCYLSTKRTTQWRSIWPLCYSFATANLKVRTIANRTSSKKKIQNTNYTRIHNHPYCTNQKHTWCGTYPKQFQLHNGGKNQETSRLRDFYKASTTLEEYLKRKTLPLPC